MERDQAEPEVWFRIVHITPEDNSDFPAYNEQTVEIALGPKGAFENGNIGVVKRLVPPDGVVNAVPPRLLKPRPQKTPRTPRVVIMLSETFRLAKKYGKCPYVFPEGKGRRKGNRNRYGVPGFYVPGFYGIPGF